MFTDERRGRGRRHAIAAAPAAAVHADPSAAVVPAARPGILQPTR